ncbi:MAG: Glu-tRNA(Gln) amidotransferase subunit GatD, partial [Euryarchaeota archaeon]|nr:Glu-tRNA(Gln) amidotransferase subunit GatD [Euryarchaeota archaeon]
SKGVTYEGILMPRSELGDDKHIVIKLDNGYNVGIEVSEKTPVEKVAVGEEFAIKFPFKIIEDPTKPTVSILSTGGTIASRVDYKTGAVSPAFSAEDLLQAVPELVNFANIKGRPIFNILSENMSPEKWIQLAHEVTKEIESNVSGVVITHGTDTLGYTSAALSFMLKNLPVPVVLIGAQRSSDRGSSDAAINLVDGVAVAANAPFAQVVVVMHGEKSDSYCLIHPGTRVRKMHSSKRDAFQTINATSIGKVENGKITLFRNDYIPRSKRKILVDDKFEPKVALVKTYPGIRSDIIDLLINAGYKGIVIEGTGLGHAPEWLFDPIEKAIRNKIPVVMTSQTIFGRVNMSVYSTGRELLARGVIPGGDMLAEVAYIKLGWLLAHYKDIEDIRRMMLTNISGEITT